MEACCPQEDLAVVCEAPGRDGMWCSQHLQRQYRGNRFPIKQVALEENKRVQGINVLLAVFALSYFNFYLSLSQGWVSLGCGSDHLLCKSSGKAESTALWLLPVLYNTLFCIFFKTLQTDFFFPFSSLSSFVWSWTSRRCQTSASGRALEDVGRVLFPKNPQASYTRYISP